MEGQPAALPSPQKGSRCSVRLCWRCRHVYVKLQHKLRQFNDLWVLNTVRRCASVPKHTPDCK